LINFSLKQSTIEINKKNLRENLLFFKNLSKTKKVFPVIKANGYGHGADKVVDAIDDIADGYCVHSIFELDSFETKKPVIVLGHYLCETKLMSAYMKKYNLLFTVYDLCNLSQIEKSAIVLNKVVEIYIKLETGTNRLGVDKNKAVEIMKTIKDSKNLKFAGFSMHFANIEDTTDHSFAKQQLDLFKKIVESIGIKHNFRLISACSAAALLFENTRMDIVRLGISLYGYFSSSETYVSYKNSKNSIENPLTPVLTWKTLILQIKTVKKGEYIGYGLTYKANSDMKIAVLPIGYSDGYDRNLSNCGFVLIKGQRAPICGRICMNLTMVDISHIEKIDINEEVVLIGKSEKEEITANTLAELTGSINYQILASINPLIPRILK